MENLFWPVVLIGASVALFVVYNLFRALKSKNEVPGSQDELEMQLLRNREKKSLENTQVVEDGKTEAAAVEAASLSKEVPPAEKIKTAENAGKKELWQRWCQQTGGWNMDIRLVTAAAAVLSSEQLECLLSVYRNDHPDLYRGVLSDPEWRKRCANPPAVFIGERIEVLKKAYFATIPAGGERLWSWWLEKTAETTDGDILEHIMSFMAKPQLETVKKRLELCLSQADKHCPPEAKSSEGFCRAQFIAVRAFLKSVK